MSGNFVIRLAGAGWAVSRSQNVTSSAGRRATGAWQSRSCGAWNPKSGRPLKQHQRS